MVEYQDETERLALEQLVAYYAQLRQVATTAAAGTVLAACEQVALTDGRQMLRDTLAKAVQTRVGQEEKKTRFASVAAANAIGIKGSARGKW